MRCFYALIVAAAVAGPAMGSPGSDAAYEAGKRHVEARQYDLGLALLDRAASADPDAPSGHQARLLQLLILNAHVGRCLSSLSSYDRGLQHRPAAGSEALQAQRDAVAEEGYRYLRQLLRASQGYRQHLPQRAECLLELAPPERWNLPLINAAEAKIEAGRALAPTERQSYQSQSLRVWLYLTLSELYCRPGRDDSEVVQKVQEVMKSGEHLDPWITLATVVDTLAAVVNRSLLDQEMGRAQIVHKEMRSCVSALLLKAPADEGLVARAKAEASAKQVFGDRRGEEWFHDLELATRLVKARQ